MEPLQAQLNMDRQANEAPSTPILWRPKGVHLPDLLLVVQENTGIKLRHPLVGALADLTSDSRPARTGESSESGANQANSKHREP